MDIQQNCPRCKEPFIPNLQEAQEFLRKEADRDFIAWLKQSFQQLIQISDVDLVGLFCPYDRMTFLSKPLDSTDTWIPLIDSKEYMEIKNMFGMHRL